MKSLHELILYTFFARVMGYPFGFDFLIRALMDSGNYITTSGISYRDREWKGVARTRGDHEPDNDDLSWLSKLLV